MRALLRFLFMGAILNLFCSDLHGIILCQLCPVLICIFWSVLEPFLSRCLSGKKPGCRSLTGSAPKYEGYAVRWQLLSMQLTHTCLFPTFFQMFCRKCLEVIRSSCWCCVVEFLMPLGSQLSDWGHAKDYIKGMWLMVQKDEPSDYVLSTGECHSVKEFVEEVRLHERGRGDGSGCVLSPSNGGLDSWSSVTVDERRLRLWNSE